MNYKKLIGYTLDTNQFTSRVIEDEIYAEQICNKATSIYGKDILKLMYLKSNNRFSTFAISGISLFNFLNEK